jgi:hypothetical protein
MTPLDLEADTLRKDIQATVFLDDLYRFVFPDGELDIQALKTLVFGLLPRVQRAVWGKQLAAVRQWVEEAAEEGR